MHTNITLYVAHQVKMVVVGGLRKHYILLASSMTYDGNLVVFNTIGYKALSFHLRVEATFSISGSHFYITLNANVFCKLGDAT